MVKEPEERKIEDNGQLEQLPSKEDLYRMYWNERLTQIDIGKIYNKSNVWVHEQMKKYKIPTRNTIDLKTRFLIYVKIPNNIEDCWEWMGSKSYKGYGLFAISKGKMMSAHRFSYVSYIGEIPKGMCVCHTCDNRSCVNPNHLWIGNIKDNNIDKVKKNRQRYLSGESHPRSKLLEQNIRQITELLRKGVSIKDIAEKYQISLWTIYDIKNGRSWKHIK